jgi:hypothetical protein
MHGKSALGRVSITLQRNHFSNLEWEVLFRNKFRYSMAAQGAVGIYSARLALYLTTLATGNGMTYPATDYEKWLHLVGFEEVHTISGLAYEHGLTSGRKPVDTDGFT